MFSLIKKLENKIENINSEIKKKKEKRWKLFDMTN